MPRTGRPGLTHREKRELWNRWKAGQTLSEIGWALNKYAGSVHGVLAVTGGARVFDRDLQSEPSRAAQLPDQRPHCHRQWAQTKAHRSAAAMELPHIGGTKASLTERRAVTDDDCSRGGFRRMV